MPDPLVSVLILTYNHEKYIRDAVEGCLEQKTDFHYEIIVHDDASTDGTTEIIKKYVDKYPDLIFPILQSENQLSKGVNITPTILIPMAKGKYIAFCEGDDFWTDSEKLQKQVDFLELNPNYSGSAHQSIVYLKENSRKFKSNVKSDLFLTDLVGQRLFHTASLVFRKDLILKYPPLPKYIVSFDRLLFILISANGPIRYTDKEMCIYRKHDEGMSALVTYKQLKKDFLTVDYLQNNIRKFPKYRFLSFLHYSVILYPEEKLRFVIILKHFFPFVLYSFTYFPKNLQIIASTTVQLLKKLFFSSINIQVEKE